MTASTKVITISLFSQLAEKKHESYRYSTRRYAANKFYHSPVVSFWCCNLLCNVCDEISHHDETKKGQKFMLRDQ